MRLFVYGSLKRGYQHADELSGAHFLGAARTLDPAWLFQVDDYPALVFPSAQPGWLATPDPSAGPGYITGEVFEIGEVLLARLDRFEDVPQLYQRRIISVALEAGDRVLTSETYVMRAEQVEEFSQRGRVTRLPRRTW
ncbi:MAG: gamma-glutamylcyclotransferase [Polyangiaceae bacterium]|nr:gamma-glutamylcyclotransferase [Myxococcales bacterium]MCB9590332.1 gamma-glutamylcyclotransferase [Polyangiaceae bacterium]MCB9605013.1 gamma-glutamylcyclotransferase [Polyangiaceae bacterium]